MNINGKKIRPLQLLCLVAYYGFAQYLPVSNTYLGKFLFSKAIRYFLCKHIFKYCGTNVNIEHRACFGSGYALEIGDNSGLGIRCQVPSNTIIGSDVMMGPNGKIFGANHRTDRTDIPMNQQGMTEWKQTVIGNDVWIGQDVLFTPGHTINSGTVIAARSVVTKDFPAYSVIGGVPAKIIKSRK